MKNILLFLGAILMTQPLSAADTLVIHYSRLDKNYAGWNLWIWNEEEKRPGFELPPSGTDAFGAVYELPLGKFALNGKKTGVLPRLGNWADKDVPDRLLAPAAPGAIYLLEGDPAVYAAPPEISTRITGAYLDSSSDVRVAFNRPLNRAFVEKQAFYLTRGDNAFQPLKAEPVGGAYSRAARLTFDSLGSPDYQALNAGRYEVHSRDFKPAKVTLGDAVYGRHFTSRLEMGLTFSGEDAVLRIFAPYAVRAEALVYDTPDAKPAVHPLEHKEAGVWEKNFGGLLAGKSYRLRVSQGGRVYEGLDPYARCVTGDDGRALAAADATPVSPGPVFDLSETVLYEVHLRDLTSDAFSGVKDKGKYLGAAEAGTRHPRFPEIATGLDHIAELGVNAVHILPFQDFENADSTSAYNWGYMPVNFNSPEGAYASNPADLSRVREAKQMIDAFHRKGLKVIMDVVYNHTAETRSRIYNFNALAMDYYYRVNPDGTYSNGSGCGNEFRTEAPMARRFLVDSLLYWTREYKVDGFRFDLMGLIDLDAVSELVRELRKAKPDIIVYGEPWTSGPTPARGVKKGSQRSRGFSVFNDGFRDAIKGSVFSIADLGYVQAARNRDAVMRGIRGSVDDFTDGPLETLNYVSCHDNHTLWDRIDLSLKDEPVENKVRMDKLANALVLTSQGIPFLHAGEEFLRTKKGEENSYNLSDEINRLDWTRKKEHQAVYEYYRDLVALRRAHPAFRMRTAAEVRENLKFYDELGLALEPPAIAYLLYGGRVRDGWDRILVLVNPEKTARKFALPMGKWLKAFDQSGLVKEPGAPVSAFFEAEPLSLTVLRL
ncbi:MAG: type I pullulanase [Elusimicrobia bacterium GWA2_61_42]|nr:MAG: type I pullulanase [Elusimicrobia bacterium GWA2_61_42]OGR75864.1 MAG: type I pullulanase [Elusimicrobia bacterium GWC2_61_25]